MNVCTLNSRFSRWRRLEYVLGRLNRNESGAFLLMGLVAVLIVFITALAMFDTGSSTRTKLQAQVATDTAAYSASVVRARTMNQIAFANIAKRTVVGITAGYASVFTFFESVYSFLNKICGASAVLLAVPGMQALAAKFMEWSCTKAAEWLPYYFAELGDYYRFVMNMWTSYLTDLIALDNVQRYFIELGPWWVWTEATDRAARNGALAASTYPSPEYKVPTILGFGQITADYMKRIFLGLKPTVYLETPVEKPVESWGFWSWPKDTMREALEDKSYSGNAFVLDCINVLNLPPPEACMNIYYNFLNSKGSPKGIRATAVAAHPKFRIKNIPVIGSFLSAINSIPIFRIKDYGDGYDLAKFQFGEYAQPFQIKEEYKGDYDKWLMATSVFVLTYTSRPNTSRLDKERYRYLPGDYNQRGYSRDYYDVNGQWNMAKSEIFFKPSKTVEQPDVWHTQWTARMRPLNIGNEWKANGDLTMATIAMEAYPFMALSIALRNPFQFENFSIHDAKTLARSIKGIDTKGVNGVGK